ncbi:ly-6/neurotoxin-like protein 1 [Engraulis encrasicolus]|uniref:ly-6/neurotoxin-like protein 1 n=1 Tax=Engraulis encrasicolus TaxID=184585 RepID=UPI002FCF6D3C
MSRKTALSIVILASLVSTADFLQCYVCAGDRCTDKPMSCPPLQDRCLKMETGKEGAFIKSCGLQAACDINIEAAGLKTLCCDTDLCNGAGTVGKNLLLLLVPLASIFVLS